MAIFHNYVKLLEGTSYIIPSDLRRSHRTVTLMPHELLRWYNQFHVEVTKFCGMTSRGNLVSSGFMVTNYMGMWKADISCKVTM